MGSVYLLVWQEGQGPPLKGVPAPSLLYQM